MKKIVIFITLIKYAKTALLVCVSLVLVACSDADGAATNKRGHKPKPVLNIPSEQLIDNFESYTSNEALSEVYLPAGGDSVVMNLAKRFVHTGKAAGMLNYELGVNGYAGVQHTVNLDWSTMNTLSFWLVPDGYAQRLVIQLQANGIHWEAYAILGHTGMDIPVDTVNANAEPGRILDEWYRPRVVHIPFGDFLKAPWDGSFGLFDPSSITQFSIFVNALSTDGADVLITDGRVIFDDIYAEFIEGNGDFSEVIQPEPFDPLVVVDVDFEQPQSVEQWNAVSWGGAASATLTHEEGAMLISPVWANAVEDKLALISPLDDTISLGGASLSFSLQLPASYVDDGQMGVQFFFFDSESRYANLGWLPASGFKPGEWTQIRLSDISMDSFGWFAEGFDIGSVNQMGLELVSNSKPLEVVGDLLLDNIKIIYSNGTRIMPLGDSITGSPGCWRSDLWNALLDRGIANIDFVGSLNTPSCGVEHDADNEGHGGFLSTIIASDQLLPAWLEVSNPEIVLMHLGTNDIWSGLPTQDILNSYTTLLAQMRENNPAVTVLVAQLIGMNPIAPNECDACAEGVVALNAAIPEWAQRLSTDESPIVVVDQWTGFDTSIDTNDGVHPNESGNAKIAAKWLGVLTLLLE